MLYKCPYCGIEMQRGELRIHGTATGFFLVGLSYENLYFKTEENHEIKVLDSFSKLPSLRCESCDILILNKPNQSKFIGKYKITEEKFKEICVSNILQILGFWSSYEQQVKYQNEFVNLNVVDELFEQWNDLFNIDSKDFINAFSTKDFALISNFNNEISKVYVNLPRNKPHLDEFYLTNEWKSLNDLAKKTLSELENKTIISMR